MTELDPQAAAWLEAARAANTEIARLTEIRDRAIGHVKNALGDNEQATIDGRPVVAWAWSKPGKRLDRKALERDFGDLRAYEIENTPARPFKILDVS